VWKRPAIDQAIDFDRLRQARSNLLGQTTQERL
jgi:hypothetical protein